MKKKRLSTPDIYTLAYRLFGRWAELIQTYFEDLEKEIKRAGMKISLTRYISRMLFAAFIAFLIGFFVSLPILLMRAMPFYALTMSLGIGLLTGGIAFWIIYTLPTISASNRKGRMEKALTFVVNYMAILSAAGIIPERIFKSLSTSDIDPVIREEIAEVVRGTEILGEDFYSALRRRSDETPSKQFSELLKGVLMVSNAGGDLKRYLRIQAKYFMKRRRVVLKKGLEQLGVLAEVYVTAGIVMPMVIIIMLSTMSIIGGGGINVILWLYLTTFFIIPIVSTALIILIDLMVPKEE
ncbi:MAG: type II secretion system F family protein [Candidatus Methanomethyliaceae archaeon]|nr:type II secretion system F family protein [Candidatus Methanomethyliaceae archaeon]